MATVRVAEKCGAAILAIYHLRASVISRSQGRSATAAIAYRVAERIADRRTGLVFDYAAKSGVQHTEILAPSHAPDWVSDRSELWNRVEEAERRKDSQVAREVRVALPDELSHAERVELVRGFAQAQFVERGMVADVAIHAPGREGDERNHHAHILLTTREVGDDGFAAKNRDWNKVELLQEWRKAWSRDTNAALERCGGAERVDHRTLAAQREEALELATAARDRGDEGEELAQTVRAVELDRPPLPQLSPGAWQMKQRGHEVGRVAAWHEAKARAAEVREIAAGLAREVGAWIADRAAGVVDRVRERIAPAQDELALAGGRDGRVEMEDARDLATRLREAWQAPRERTAAPEASRTEVPERDPPDLDADDLAMRLRMGSAGIDWDDYADRAAALRDANADEKLRVEQREADRLHAQDRAEALAREEERAREIEKESERSRDRDTGWGHGR